MSHVDSSPDPHSRRSLRFRSGPWARRSWPGERWLFATLIVPLILAGAALWLDGEEIETSLATQVRERLVSQGISGVAVTVEGRDVALKVPTGINLGRAETVADRVPGVRGVSASRIAASAAEKRACARLKRDSRDGVRDASVVFSGSSVALPSDSRALADRVAALMVTCPSFDVEVGGHASDRGDAAGLSQERARVVQALLVSRGVPPGRVSVRGYGNQFPTAKPERVSLVFKVGG